MELDSRPLLLSPALPRLPGADQERSAEPPPLSAADFAPRPPPLPCEPLPREVQQRLDGGEGMLAVLEGYRRHSQLAWCQQDQQAQAAAAAAAAVAAAERETAAAAAAALEQQQSPRHREPQARQPQQQGERLAWANRPATLPAARAPADGDEAGSESEGGVPSDPVPRPASRASVAPHPRPPQHVQAEAAEAAEADNRQPPAASMQGSPAEAAESVLTLDAGVDATPGWDGGGDGLSAMLEEELARDGNDGGDAIMADAELADAELADAELADAVAAAPAGPKAPAIRTAAAASPPPPPPPTTTTTAAVAKAAARQSAVEPAPPTAQRRQPARQRVAAGVPAAAPAAATVSAPHAVMPSKQQQQQQLELEIAARAATAAAAAAGAGAEASSEEEQGDGTQGQRKRPVSAQQAAQEAALQKIGEESWENFCQKLQQQRLADEGAGGGRGRGRGGRKGGRKGGRSGDGQQQQRGIRLTDVLNRKSHAYHAEFAAAYQEAKEQLAKTDAKRQRQEALREHSKLVRRWSDLSAREHEWFMHNQGLPLVGSDAQRMSLLQERVGAEQQRYWQDVQQQAAGGTAAQRYHHATARQLAQLEDDAAQRRQRVLQQLPRCYHLRTVLPVPAAAPPAGAVAAQQPAEQEVQLRHVGSLRKEGQLPAFVAPLAGTKLLGDKLYLPCTVTAGGSGRSGSGGTTAPAGVYRKHAVLSLAEDPLLLEVATQAWQQGAAPAAARQEAGEQVEEEQQQQDAGAEAQPLYCLSAAAFATIVSTPMLQRRPAWEIPITVQAPPAADAGAGGGGRRPALVCVDKPLLPRMLTMRAKQQQLQKYAVLSLGVQRQQQQQQPAGPAEQQEQQELLPARQTRRSARSGTAQAADDTAGMPAGRAAGAAAASALPARETAYDCWQLGGCRLLVRSHGRMLLQQPASPQRAAEDAAAAGEGVGAAEQHGPGFAGEQQARQAQQVQHVVLAVKTEYLPEEESEEFTVDELCHWWLRLRLRPDVDSVLAAHVHVPHSKVLSTETLSAVQLARHVSGDHSRDSGDEGGEEGGDGDDGGGGGTSRMRQLAAAGLVLLQQVLQALGAVPPGRYLLAHAPGEPTCCLFKAVSAEAMEAVEGAPDPLPCSATLARPSSIYDLHAAHQRSGATDTETPGFVPPRWRPFHPDIPQIPYTFPPSGLGLGQMGRQQNYKKRQRKVLPHAWKVLGEGGDFDQVQHVAQISRADYMAGLEEELE